ncbi:MAG: 50S ribosomal protein L28 [Candidatus Nealsonbacteria bacterium]|nr:50S ribosomal protein L28 [Candidatus Nealsonbacteria bacterium]
MSRQCTICGKKPIMAWTLKKLRGKYNPTVKKRKLPNIQWATLASGKRIRACVACIRTLSKGKSKIRNTKSETISKS